MIFYPLGEGSNRLGIALIEDVGLSFSAGLIELSRRRFEALCILARDDKLIAAFAKLASRF
jgi:hypothetical protein